MDWKAMPGGDLVEKGLADLTAGRLTDSERIRAFMAELGRRARTPASVYLTGGATAVLQGWRQSTLDPVSLRRAVLEVVGESG